MNSVLGSIISWKESNDERLQQISIDNPQLYNAIGGALNFLSKKYAGEEVALVDIKEPIEETIQPIVEPQIQPTLEPIIDDIVELERFEEKKEEDDLTIEEMDILEQMLEDPELDFDLSEEDIENLEF